MNRPKGGKVVKEKGSMGGNGCEVNSETMTGGGKEKMEYSGRGDNE